MNWLGIAEKLLLKALAWILANKGLADVDKDGDVDFDDVWSTYLEVKEVVKDAQSYFAEWDAWTRGQRIDAVVEYIKGETGTALKGAVIAVLETVAWVVCWVAGTSK